MITRRHAMAAAFLPALAPTPTPTPTRRARVTELPPSTGGDDTQLIAAAFAAGGRITGLYGETYTVSAVPRIPSNTLLDLRGVTIRLAPGSNCNMLQNVAVAGGGRDHDITIIGGTFDRGDNAGTGNSRHNLFFRHVDRLTVIGVRVVSTGGKYAIAVGDATQLAVRDITFDTASDGLHLTGPIRNADVQNLSGRTGDDMFAITARDWAAYDDTAGPVRNVTARGIYCDPGTLAAVKIVGGTGTDVEAVSVSGVYGTTRIRPIAIITDQTGPTVVSGIRIENVDMAWTDTTYSMVWLRGITAADVKFEDLAVRGPVASGNLFLVDGGSDIDSLIIDGLFIDPAAVTQAAVVVVANAHVEALRMTRERFPASIAWKGPHVQLSGTGSIASPVITDVYTYH